MQTLKRINYFFRGTPILKNLVKIFETEPKSKMLYNRLFSVLFTILFIVFFHKTFWVQSDNEISFTIYLLKVFWDGKILFLFTAFAFAFIEETFLSFFLYKKSWNRNGYGFYFTIRNINTCIRACSNLLLVFFCIIFAFVFFNFNTLDV